MLKALKQIFTWWNGNTVNTKFFTWRKGNKVGKDEFDNIYYEGGMHKDGYPRRWVIYKNYSDASSIPPGWHGWIHHRTDIAPVHEVYVPYVWEKPHLINFTGTKYAYIPKKTQKVGSDYSSWKPYNISDKD